MIHFRLSFLGLWAHKRVTDGQGFAITIIDMQINEGTHCNVSV